MILDRSTLRKLKSNKISLEEYFLLYSKYKSLGLTLLYRPSSDIYDQLKERGILNKSNGITAKGRELFEAISGEEPENEVRKHFNKFWDKFPTSDKWGNFQATRALKQNKKKCYQRYKNLLSKGEKPENLAKELESELKWRMTFSTSQENKMKWMKGSLSWLNQEDYNIYQSMNNNKTDEYNDISVS